MQWMILNIAGRELRSFFLSPLAWTILAIIVAIHTYVLLVQIERFTEWLPQLVDVAGAPGLSELVVRPLIKTAGFVLLLVVPAITMHLIAEERRSGTIDLLLTSPVSMTEIVIGKYLGVMGYLLSLVAAVGILPLLLLAGGTLDIGLYLACMLALSLLLAALGAAGLFVSTLTRHPAIAAIGSLALLLMLWILDWAGGTDASGLGGVLAYLALSTHFDAMLNGLVDTYDITYFVLLAVGFLCLSIERLDAYRSEG